MFINYPESANAYVSLGAAYRASGDIKLAVDSFERALAIDSNHYWSKWTVQTLKELKAHE